MMAAIQPPQRCVSHERGPVNNYSVISPPGSDRSSVRNGAPSRGPDEHRNPPAMPKSFEGMLKTTTETGDIGLFSIKPSRLPQPLSCPRRIPGAYNDNSMEKPRHFQPYCVPNVDDRRRLPSYARDASSEIISMYETASQKSAGRVFDESDSRSYSMTHTYSSYSLSNHRSYASLRSQPDAGASVQRPRSPFAYPTRLKRPGFRPSSPALTDGGAIDYSRRAEIDRIPHGQNHHTSSPASLYAQKRKPPLSLRHDANKSTPSLLSQSSPQRRSPSPNTRQGSGTPSNDWQRRNGPASVTTSPARSTFSLASTVNLYQTAPALSTTMTPGKIHPPSPLYYDYTEDFDIDNYNQPEVLDPPPQFQIDKTIPEDRPLSSEWPSIDCSDVHGLKSNFSSGLHTSLSGASVLQKSLESSQDSHITNLGLDVMRPVDGPSNHDPTTTVEDYPENNTTDLRDKKVIRLSGLGLGARELSTHVEEAFGLLPSPSFEIAIANKQENRENVEDSLLNADGNESENRSVRTSSYSLNCDLRQFPPPPKYSDQQSSHLNGGTAGSSQIAALCPDELMDPRNSSTPQDFSSEPLLPMRSSENDVPSSARKGFGDTTVTHPPRSSSLQSDRKSPSRPLSIDTGLNELEELIISTFQDARPSRRSRGQQPVQDTLGEKLVTSSTPPDESPFSSPPSPQRIRPALPLFNRLATENNHKIAPEQSLRRSYHRYRPRRLEVAAVPSIPGSDVPNFSHQFPMKLIPRSESPMLAPKPISPARQLRLKNSVPQLMKSLPPLPPDPLIRAVSRPLPLPSSQVELPCRFSPLLPEARPTPPQYLPQTTELQVIPEPGQALSTQKSSVTVESDFSPPCISFTEKKADEQESATPPPPPKLKLKMRSSSILRPKSPPASRPWNLEESYPWSSQAPSIRLPSMIQGEKSANSKPPRFKLKITRASNSTLGTVRVNRESGDSNPSSGLHLRYTRDLFTPSSGIDNIFRQVGKHLHARKASATSDHHTVENRCIPISINTSEQKSPFPSSSFDENNPRKSPTSAPTIATEAASFFSDDSSQVQSGGHSLRKGLSNLKDRIAVPYGTRNGAQSYDDLNWRDRNGADAPTPSASKSIPNLHESRSSTEARPTRRLTDRIHTQRLRAKFSVWFKGARSAIAARVKSRKAAGRNNDDQVQLATVV